MRNDELLHYNVKGTNWYRHKFGNWERHAKYANGQPNPDTRIKRNVFISGTSKMKLEDSEFYRKKLPNEVRKKVDEYIKNGDHIIIGDAPGIDTEIQRYLADKKYKDVSVYTIGKHPRAYFDEDKTLGWKVKKIKSATGDQADKDKAMSKDADIGFAVTIEDGAKATRNNVRRMEESGKSVEVFSLNKNGKDAWEKKYAGEKPDINKDSIRKKIDTYKGRRDASVDAAIQVLSRGNTGYAPSAGIWDLDSNHASVVSGSFNPSPDSIAVGLISAVGIGTLGKVVGYNHPFLVSPVALVPLNMYDRGKNIKSYNERYGTDLTYKDVTTRSRSEELKRQPFNKTLPESTILNQKLSKDYVKAYSKGMNLALKQYDKRSYSQVKD